MSSGLLPSPKALSLLSRADHGDARDRNRNLQPNLYPASLITDSAGVPVQARNTGGGLNNIVNEGASGVDGLAVE